jgi:hypothetical protein
MFQVDAQTIATASPDLSDSEFRVLEELTEDGNIFVTLAGTRLFCTLDRKVGYWQVGLHPNDKEQITFSTGQRLWQLTIMPFGFCNAPAKL